MSFIFYFHNNSNIYQLQKSHELHILFSCKVFVQLHETLLLDLVKIHSFYQAVYALLIFHSILLNPHNFKHYCEIIDIHCKWNTTSWPLQMYFLSVLFLIFRLNSLFPLLDFVENKRKTGFFYQFYLWYYRDLWKMFRNVLYKPFYAFSPLNVAAPLTRTLKKLFLWKE